MLYKIVIVIRVSYYIYIENVFLCVCWFCLRSICLSYKTSKLYPTELFSNS